MSDSRWVQHISGQGEKWKVDRENDYQWGIVPRESGIGFHYLPKSEFILCDPPEVWKDVTKECTVEDGGEILHGFSYTMIEHGYRRRKIEVDGKSYLIVEKKVSS